MRDVELRDGAMFIKGRTIFAPHESAEGAEGAVRATMRSFDSRRAGSLTLRSAEGVPYGEESFACTAFVSSDGASVTVFLRDKSADIAEPRRHTFPLSPAIKEGDAFTLELRTEKGQIAVRVNGREAGALKDTWTTGNRRFGLTPSNTEMTEFRAVAVQAKPGG